jgi:hypothetical protein
VPTAPCWSAKFHHTLQRDRATYLEMQQDIASTEAKELRSAMDERQGADHDASEQYEQSNAKKSNVEEVEMTILRVDQKSPLYTSSKRRNDFTP